MVTIIFFKIYYFTGWVKFRSKKDKSINASWAFQQINHFGRLFDYNDEKSTELQEFQDILDKIDTPGNSGIYDLQAQMLKVIIFN